MVKERFAFCQTLPLDRFDGVQTALARCGYRPLVSPYAVGDTVRTAGVGSRWPPGGVMYGVTADKVEPRRSSQPGRRFPTLRRGGLPKRSWRTVRGGVGEGDGWRAAAKALRRRAGVAARGRWLGAAALEGVRAVGLCRRAGRGRRARFCGVWGKADPRHFTPNFVWIRLRWRQRTGQSADGRLRLRAGPPPRAARHWNGHSPMPPRRSRTTRSTPKALLGRAWAAPLSQDRDA
jgi:hypothetical protein